MSMLQDFVLETSSNPGVGDFVLNGAAQDRVSFSQAFPGGGRIFYFADDGTQAEWGIGTLTVGNPATLARSTVLGNTLGSTGLLRFTAGVEVYNEVPARFLALLDEDGGLTVAGKIAATTLAVSGQALVPDIDDWGLNEALGAAAAKAKFVKQGWSVANLGGNQIYIGWRTDGTGLGVVVDATDLGNVAFKSWVGETYATQDALSSVQKTASSALVAAQAAQGAADAKLDDTDGAATRLTVNYGSMRAQFQGDGNFVLYSGETPVFSVSNASIRWNDHSFAFLDSLPMDSSQKIIFDQVSGVAAGGRVNFPSAFSSPPKVLAQNFGTGDANCHTATTDTGGFTLHINNGGSTDITYVAIGDK